MKDLWRELKVLLANQFLWWAFCMYPNAKDSETWQVVMLASVRHWEAENQRIELELARQKIEKDVKKWQR